MNLTSKHNYLNNLGRKSYFFGVLITLLLFAANSTVGAQGNPAVTIDVQPHNAPITIQADGGSYDFLITFKNNEDTAVTMDIWTSINHLDTQAVTVMKVYEDFRILPGWSTTKIATHTIAANLPAGSYGAGAVVGNYPGEVWQWDAFLFEKENDVDPWFTQNSGVTSLLFGISFPDSQNGWAVGSLNTVLRTDDGGNNWYNLNVPPSAHYYDVQFLNENDGWIVGTKVLETHDGADTLIDKSSEFSYTISALHFVDELNGWMVGGRARGFNFDPIRTVYATTDGGQNWTRQMYEYNEEPLNDVYFVNKNKGFAISDLGQIIATFDGGQTWLDAPSPIGENLFAVFFTDESHGYIAAHGGTIMSTDNGGRSWEITVLNASYSFSDIYFSDANNGWAVGGSSEEGVIFKTDDAGSTWHKQTLNTEEYIYSVDFSNGSNGWAVGRSGAIFHTRTAGE